MPAGGTDLEHVAGDVLAGRYRLDALLGTGGMATAWRVEDLVRRERVALKLLRADSPDLASALRSEFERLRGVHHPHLLRVRDFAAVPGGARCFYTADLVAGAPLDVFARGRPWEAIAPVVCDVLDALAFLHRIGLRHGDVKADNVIVGDDGRATLIDLGCARPLGDASLLGIAGTPNHLAPELLESGAADGRADLFALGVTLASLLPADAPSTVRALVTRLRAARPADRPAESSEALSLLGEERMLCGPPAGHSVGLLGREAELDQAERLLALHRDARPGPRVLFLRGDDGCGRTRLLNELKWRAQLQGPVVEAGPGPGAIRDLLARAGVEVGPGLEGIVDACDSATHGPAVLVLDDAHALDSEDRGHLAAMLRLARTDGPWVLVCASRDAPPSSEAIATIEVGPLSPDAVARWSAGVLTPDRARELHRRTGGVCADVRAALARIAAAAVGEADIADAVDDPATGLPPLPEQATERERLARIVVGVRERDDDATETMRLQRDGWIRRAGGRWVLCRASLAGRLSEQLGQPLLVAAHRAAADALEAEGPGGQDELARVRWEATRVWHLACAGDEDAAVLFVAARDSHAAAPREWLPAAGALGRHRDPEVVLGAAAVHELAGQTDLALTTLARLLRARPAAAWAARCRVRAAACYLKSGRARAASRMLDRAWEDLDGEEDRASALDLRARISIQQGDHDAGRRYAEQGLSCAEGSTLRGRLHESVGLCASYLGEAEAARTHLDAALAHRDDDPRSEVRIRSYQAIAAYREGRLPDAADGYRAALAITERHGLSDQLASAAANLGTVCHLHGDWGTALDAYTRAARLSRALDKRSTELTLRFNTANLFAAIGAFDRADALLAEARERIREVGADHLTGHVALLASEIAHGRGDGASARRALELAAAHFAERGAGRELAEARVALAELDAGVDEVAADASLAAAEGAVTGLDALDLEARVRLGRGAWLTRAGRPADAMSVLEQGERLAARAGDRHLTAELAAALADACAAAGAPELEARHRARCRARLQRIEATLEPELRDAFRAHPRRRAWLADVTIAPPAASRATAGAAETSLRRVLEINARLNASPTADGVLECAIDAAIELTGAERGFVLERRHDGELRVAVARNVDREKVGRSHLKFSRSIAERVVEEAEPVVTTDAQGDARFAGQRSVHAMRLKSVLCVPIPSGNDVLGAIYVDNRFQPARFSPADVELLLAFAVQVGIALRNARVHATLERRTRELEEEKARVEALLAERDRQVGRLEEEVESRRRELRYRYDYAQIIGDGPAMRAVFDTLERVIDSTVSVLVVGESGTGKELVARAIHYNGPRRDARFVSINCAALPEALLESELFGHRRGAFTGADRDHEGLLVSAAGGTLFLDEVGEMPAAMQAKLLRALQEREVRPVGAAATVPIDVRLVCATNRDLRREVAEGRFRSDLYYRIGVVEIALPPLRDRLEDLPALCHALMARIDPDRDPPPRLTAAAARLLRDHPWPGNVRELDNVLRRALLMARGSALSPDDLDLHQAPTPHDDSADAEARRIAEALRATRWNVAEVSRRLGIPRNTLYRRLKLYGLERPG